MIRCPVCDSYKELEDRCEDCGHKEYREGADPMEMPLKMKQLVKSGKVIYLPDLDNRDQRYITKRSTLKHKPYKGDAVTVCCHVKEGDWLWVPRFFDEENEFPGKEEYADGVRHEFDFKLTLDPERGQPEAVERMFDYLLSYGGGVLQAFTGCGKTIMGYAIAAKFKTRIAVLVYQDHMTDNWVTHADKCFGIPEEDIGVVRGARCDLDKPITIMSVQTLYSGRTFPPELFDKFGVVVADEVHRYGAPVWQTTIQRFSARYRLGMSADPHRSDGLGAIIPWNFGLVGHVTPKPDSIAKPKVILVDYDNEPYKPGSYQSWPARKPEFTKYRKVVSKDEGRNMLIDKLLVDARNKGRKAIVFSHYRMHLRRLKVEFDKAIAKAKEAPLKGTKSVLFIAKSRQKGEPQNMKDMICTLEEALEADFIFTTYSMGGTGFNATQLDTGIPTTPVAKPLQPIGRLRDKGDEGRQPLMWVDITERNTPFAVDKSELRVEAYQDLGCEVVRLSKKRIKPPEPKPKKRRRRTAKTVKTKKGGS